MQIGIVGCGVVAQTMHIPHVVELPGVELAALCDPAADRLATLADRYNVPGRYEDVTAMLADRPPLDAVIVLSPMQHHAAAVEQTLEAGVHTLVEKPLAASPAEAARLAALADASEAVAMVAYMKRYAPAFERARTEIAALDRIDLVTAYDVDPDHGRILEDVYDLVPGELPAELLAESEAKREADSLAAIDSEDPELAAAYAWHLEHICHDVNLLHALFGSVTTIEHATLGDRYLTATIRFEDDVTCLLTSGNSDRPWFEDWIRVDTPEGELTLEYFNPFIKNDPATLRSREWSTGDGRSDTTYRGPPREPFKRELERFVACCRGTTSVQTTFDEAVADVRLVADFFGEIHDSPVA